LLFAFERLTPLAKAALGEAVARRAVSGSFFRTQQPAATVGANLRFHRVLAGSVKCFDAQVLLDPLEEESVMSQEQRSIRLLVFQAVGAFVSFVLFLGGCYQIASSLLVDWDPPVPDALTDGYLTILMRKGPWPIHFYAGCVMVALSLTFFWVNRRRGQDQ
jgi:hypothetical protein